MWGCTPQSHMAEAGFEELKFDPRFGLHGETKKKKKSWFCLLFSLPQPSLILTKANPYKRKF